MNTDDARPATNQPRSGIANILIGCLLIIPAALGCAATQLVYSAGTVIMSLQKASLLAAPQFIGLDNYAHLAQDPALTTAIGFTLQSMLVRLLVVGTVPLLLAWGASVLGRWPRLILRILFTLPIVAFAPVAIALLWSITLNPISGFFQAPVFGNAPQARQTLLFIDGLYTMGLACGLGLIFQLAAFRDSAPNTWRSVWITWGIGLLATAAAALQMFALSYILTAGGPANSTTNLVLFLYKTSFQFMNFGYGATLATAVLASLAVLGVAAGAIVIFSNLRMSLVPTAEAKATPGVVGGKAYALAALVLSLLIGIAAGICALVPIMAATTTAFKGIGGNVGDLQKAMPLGSTLVNTILPPLIAVVFIQAPITYLAALGIGALRPLGKHSEWLLLPFCPWLFVGLAPLSLFGYQTAQKLDLLNTLAGLIPPLAVSIPMLVLLTLFFKGQQTQFRQAQAGGVPTGRAFFTKLILPSLPLAVVLALAGLFAGLQDPLWSMIFANKRELYPLNNILITMRGTYGTNLPLVASATLAATVPGSIFFFLAFGLFQIFYLDRLRISSGRD